MTWVKLDDQFPIHRKIAALSDPAFRLHCAALAWCARNLTDGFVSTSELAQVCAQVRAPEKFAAELVILRVWHLQDEPCPSEHCLAPHTHAENGSPVQGWVIHDYLEYQQPRSKVLRIRKNRAVSGSEGGKKSGETRRRRSQTSGSKNEANAKQVASHSLEPRPGPLQGPGAGAPGTPSGSAAYGDRPTPDGVGTPSAVPGAPAPDEHPAQPADPEPNPHLAALRAEWEAGREAFRRATAAPDQPPPRPPRR